MKKLLILLSLLLLVSCGSTAFLPDGTYLTEEEESSMNQPAIIFSAEDQSFYFTYQDLSSKLYFGNYTVSEDRIVCITGDGQSIFCFRIVDKNRLAFVEEDSTPLPTFKGSKPLEDGEEFILTEE